MDAVLQQLDAALTDQDWSGALAAARDAWPKHRDPALIELMDALQQLAPRPPVAPVGSESQKKAWHRRCAADDPADVPALMDALLDIPAAGCHEDRVEALLERTPDPRIDRALAGFLVARGALSPSNRWFWVAGITLLARHPSPSIATLLDTWQGAHRGRSKPWGRLVGKHLVALGDIPPVTPTAIPDWSSRVPAPREERGIERLWDTVYDRPRDLAARAVLADALAEAEDPRGRFMALQLARRANNPSGKASREERSLLKRWGETWLGPLSRVVLKRDQHWNGGFLTHLALTGLRPARVPEVQQCRDWRMVQHIELPEFARLDTVHHLDLRSLRSLRAFVMSDPLDFDHPHLGRLDALELSLYGEVDRDYLLRITTSLEQLSNLKRLEVDGVVSLDALRGLIELPWMQRVEWLGVPAPNAAILPLLGAPIHTWTESWNATVQGHAVSIESRGNRRSSPRRQLLWLLEALGTEQPITLTLGSLDGSGLTREALQPSFDVLQRDGQLAAVR